MRDVNGVTISISAVIFICIWIFGDGFWSAVELFCSSPQGLAMLLILIFLIIVEVMSIFQRK